MSGTGAKSIRGILLPYYPCHLNCPCRKSNVTNHPKYMLMQCASTISRKNNS